MEHKVVLNWLSSKCRPNVSPTHKWQMISARKKKKKETGIICRDLPKAKDEFIPVNIIFNPPCRRKRDLDNCLAAIKSEIDAISEQIGVDDHKFRPITIDFGKFGKPGSVEVTLTYEAI